MHQRCGAPEEGQDHVTNKRLLLVGHHPDRAGLRIQLAPFGIVVECVSEQDDGLDAVGEIDWDCIAIDTGDDPKASVNLGVVIKGTQPRTPMILLIENGIAIPENTFKIMNAVLRRPVAPKRLAEILNRIGLNLGGAHA